MAGRSAEVPAISGQESLEAALPKESDRDKADEKAGEGLNKVFDGNKAEFKTYGPPTGPEPVQKDPETGLYGVNASQRAAIIAILKKYYGSDLLDLAAVGSRAKGTASVLKNYRPATTASDLDLVPLLRTSRHDLPYPWDMAKEIQKATGIPIELHGVLSQGETRFEDFVPFYGGGNESWYYFRTGEAVRLPLD
ncbi:MAG: hypothetical protein WC943_07805 [Elusimicrobiota bacterium]|jgi:hypothetical protein